MRHRLGSFSPRPGSSDFEPLLTNEMFAAPLTRALEEMLRVRLSQATAGLPPDLLETLGPQHRDRAWVSSIHDRLARLQRDGVRLRLLACEHENGPDGFITLAAAMPAGRLEVLPGDWMQIGFAAMREGDGPVRAWPRLLREVCANGSLVCVEEWDRHEGSDGIADAIERFLTPETYEPAVRALREARATAVPDPRAYLDEFQRIENLDDLLQAHGDRILPLFEGDEDDSLYGLMNAITATARDEDDWAERLALEEMAGRLARLRRPVRSRSGAGALVPA